MTTENDKKILGLKEKIAEKKKQIERTTRFSPKTNCIIKLYGETINLNVAPYNVLELLLVQLNVLLQSAVSLGIKGFSISGYAVVDWIDDTKSRMNILSKRDEEDNLKKMEAKLSKLLSNDAQVQIEIAEIESLLN